MEAVIAIAIGVMFASGVWLILRPRTFQVIIGLLLISYAVNMFIFIMGRLSINKPPLTLDSPIEAGMFADPVTQALVLTAIVIGFATTALYLVLLLTSRGLTGTDHVDGKEPRQ
ncbi:Na+/H+ antiporter subunit C [Halopseudomonas bauzanensis]|uniref:Na+/H+ antiporter subunit C n=1 Tax=Halopseudomonas bauzanensis TaxID=653930 RepID=UPI0025564BF4|nr:Na+/H+ antiporter subunit C [Halopseudomonas bauzanensis]